MIRCGLICERCTAKHCAEKDEQLEIQCPACEGSGCEECQGGHFLLQGCPQVFVRPLYDAIQVVDWWRKKNVLPVAGGTLDQSTSFLNFCDAVEREDALVKAEHGGQGR